MEKYNERRELQITKDFEAVKQAEMSNSRKVT